MRDRKRRPSVEALEGRQLMSIGPEFIAPINTTTRNAQSEPDAASAADGTSVVVWTDTFSSSDHDIRAQRFNSFGGKTGPEIVVSFSSLDEGSPAVAMDGAGEFVVTWVQTVPGGDTNVVARRFDPNGMPVGDVVPVGVGTFKESSPDVAMDLRGDFVVSYTRNTNNNNLDVFAKQFNRNNQLLNVVNVATRPWAEDRSTVAMTQDGRFVVAWQESPFFPQLHEISMSRFDASGRLTSTTFNVSGIQIGNSNVPFDDTMPSIAEDNSGNVALAWQRNGDIESRRIFAGGEIGILMELTKTPNQELAPSVALKPGGGGYVVVYESLTSTARTKVAEVSAFDHVTTLDAGERVFPSVSIDFFGDYLLAYESLDGSDRNIRGRRGTLLF